MAIVPEMMHLPAAHVCATPDEARRFVAVLVKGRTVMAALKCERKGFASSEFVAKVMNDSDEELSCTVTGWTHRGTVQLEPRCFWIKPRSLAQIPIRAPLRLPYPVQTISLQMHNSAVRATAEADVPTPLALRLGAVFGVLAALVFGALTFRQAALPRVLAYTLPSKVAAGDVASAVYAVAGVGTAEYEVTSRGEQIAGGVLPRDSGSFTFPTSKQAGVYEVALSMVGPLGRVRRELVTAATPFSASDVLSITALQPEPGVVRSGESVNVRYVSDGQSGRVTLYDASGIALQHAPYNASGVSRLTAPAVDIPTQYRVELQVASGSTTAISSAGLLVLPNDDAVPNAPAGTLSATQLLSVPPYVVSATTFGVRLLAHPENLRLTFEDEQGTPLETEAVTPQQAITYFTAPNIAHDGSYVIDASFSRGNVQQDVLQRVLVRRAG